MIDYGHGQSSDDRPGDQDRHSRSDRHSQQREGRSGEHRGSPGGFNPRPADSRQPSSGFNPRPSESRGNILDSQYTVITKICENLFSRIHGSHRLEKYLNLEGFLEKSLKIKSALKSTGKPPKSLEKSLNLLFFL